VTSDQTRQSGVDRPVSASKPLDGDKNVYIKVAPDGRFVKPSGGMKRTERECRRRTRPKVALRPEQARCIHKRVQNCLV